MNSKVRCKGCDTYVQRDQARRLGRLGWSCGELCSLTLKERDRARKKARRLLGSSNEAGAELRAAIRERDGHRCRWCGARGGLEVHHILYRSQGGGNEGWNLITLCGACHRKAHSNKKKYQPLLLGAQWLHYVEGKRAIPIPTAARHLGIN